MWMKVEIAELAREVPVERVLGLDQRLRTRRRSRRSHGHVDRREMIERLGL
jgi:hypothetical protein